MNRLTRHGIALGAAAAAALAAVVLSPAAAMADTRPCGNPFWKNVSHGGQTVRIQVQVCPDWAPDNSIPVYAGPEARHVVGHIAAPGDDWYECQASGQRLDRFGYQNYWWAHTMADNGSWGWVNQIYFSGGGNNEPDSRLRFCPDR
jgi:hypothetical protein